MNILTLLQDKSYVWIGVLYILICCLWFIFFKLSFKIINEKMPPAMGIAALIMGAYVFGARPFVQNMVFLLVLCALSITMMCIFGRVNIIKSIYSSVLIIFISFLGDIFLLFVTLGLFPNLIPFMFGSEWGFIVGLGIEGLFPIIVLYGVMPKYSLRLPLRQKSDPFDRFDMAISWILLSMYYAMDYASMIALDAFQKNPQKIGSSLVFLFVTTFGIAGGIVILIWALKKLLELEIRRITTEKEKVEAENVNLQERMYTILDLKTILDPNLKKTIVDAFISVFEEGLKRSLRPKPPFIINQSKMAEYGIEERDSKILAHLVLNKTNQEIASELDYTEGHIANSLTEMYKKFKVKGRRQLIRFTLDNKLIEIP